MGMKYLSELAAELKQAYLDQADADAVMQWAISRSRLAQMAQSQCRQKIIDNLGQEEGMWFLDMLKAQAVPAHAPSDDVLSFANATLVQRGRHGKA